MRAALFLRLLELEDGQKQLSQGRQDKTGAPGIIRWKTWTEDRCGKTRKGGKSDDGRRSDNEEMPEGEQTVRKEG